MIINMGTIIKRYNGKPVMIEQDVYVQEDGQPLIINGLLHFTNSREMTVGGIFSSILSSKKVEQSSIYKTDVLALVSTLQM